jgi:hypothetical protein
VIVPSYETGIGSFGWFSAGHPTLEKRTPEFDNEEGLYAEHVGLVLCARKIFSTRRMKI